MRFLNIICGFENKIDYARIAMAHFVYFTVRKNRLKISIFSAGMLTLMLAKTNWWCGF